MGYKEADIDEETMQILWKSLCTPERKDPKWDRIYEELHNERVLAKGNLELLADFYIKVLHLTVECRKDPEYGFIISNPEHFLCGGLIEVKDLHEDIPYLAMLYNMRDYDDAIGVVALFSKLESLLVAIKNNSYTPLDEFSKAKIRKAAWKFYNDPEDLGFYSNMYWNYFDFK